jgi:hypothetical protein
LFNIKKRALNMDIEDLFNETYIDNKEEEKDIMVIPEYGPCSDEEEETKTTST